MRQLRQRSAQPVRVEQRRRLQLQRAELPAVEIGGGEEARAQVELARHRAAFGVGHAHQLFAGQFRQHAAAAVQLERVVEAGAPRGRAGPFGRRVRSQPRRLRQQVERAFDRQRGHEAAEHQRADRGAGTAAHRGGRSRHRPRHRVRGEMAGGPQRQAGEHRVAGDQWAVHAAEDHADQQHAEAQEQRQRAIGIGVPRGREAERRHDRARERRRPRHRSFAPQRQPAGGGLQHHRDHGAQPRPLQAIAQQAEQRAGDQEREQPARRQVLGGQVRHREQRAAEQQRRRDAARPPGGPELVPHSNSPSTRVTAPDIAANSGAAR